MSATRNPLNVCPYFIGMGFYTRDTDFDPAQTWPGTKWQKLEGVFLLAASASHAVGETGGEERHKLTREEMPNHGHVMAGATTTAPNGSDFGAWYGISDGSTGSTGGRYYEVSVKGAGGDGAHNNMPPYAVRIYWERTE